MPTLLLDGTFTATTPIAIILPAGKNDRPPAGPPRKRIVNGEVIIETAYVPPSSLRGRLRHLLTSELMRLQNAADGRVFTPEAYISTALGGVKDRRSEGDDDRRVDLKAIKEIREKNPVVSLFGSMVSKIPGRLMVSDITPVAPVEPALTGRSVRANPFVRNPAIIQLLDPARFDEFTQLNDLRTAANRAEDEAERLQIQLRGKKRAGAVAEEVQAVEVKIAELKKAAEEGFKDAGGAVNIQQLLDGYEVIPEGTVMTNRIRLIEGADIEMQLLLLALDLLAKRPLIGGHTSHGCGEIAGSWRARIATSEGVADAGTLRLEPYAGLLLEGGHPALTVAYEKAMNLKGEEVSGFDLSVP